MYNAPMKPPRKLRPVRPKLPQGRTTSVPVKKPVVKKPARSLRPVPQGRMSTIKKNTSASGTIASAKKPTVKKPTMKKPLVKKTAVRKLTAKSVVKKTAPKRPSLKEQEEKIKVTKQFLKWQNNYKNNKTADYYSYEYPPTSEIKKWWNSKGYSMNGERKLKK